VGEQGFEQLAQFGLEIFGLVLTRFGDESEQEGGVALETVIAVVEEHLTHQHDFTQLPRHEQRGLLEEVAHDSCHLHFVVHARRLGSPALDGFLELGLEVGAHVFTQQFAQTREALAHEAEQFGVVVEAVVVFLLLFGLNAVFLVVVVVRRDLAHGVSIHDHAHAV